MNMLRCPLRREFQARWKKIEPAQSMTGVASRNWDQRLSFVGRPRCSPSMERMRMGRERMTPRMKRVLSCWYSEEAEGWVCSVSWWGASLPFMASRAMPQIGQSPGLSSMIWGCIGQVYFLGASIGGILAD